MCAFIENCASCELLSVIQFLLAKNNKPIEIHRQLFEVYGEDFMTESGERGWCLMFKDGSTNIHDENQRGQPIIVRDELVEKINTKI